jgi:hypothetical protein
MENEFQAQINKPEEKSITDWLKIKSRTSISCSSLTFADVTLSGSDVCPESSRPAHLFSSGTSGTNIIIVGYISKRSKACPLLLC